NPSLVQGVVNFLGDPMKFAYDWALVGIDGVRGGSTAAMFMKEILKFDPTGTGTNRLVVKETWGSTSGYTSKLATKLRKAFNDPKSYFSRYGYRPSYLLTDIAGLSNVNTIGMAKLLERSAGPRLVYRNGQRLVNYYRRGGDFIENAINLYKNVRENFKPTINSLDVKNSLNKFKNDARQSIDKIRNFDAKNSLQKFKNFDAKNSFNNVKQSMKPGAGLGKNLARGATVLSVGLNFMEAFSDDHKDKSTAERTGRALAGSALDIGAGAAGAAAGAAIGTMIFPGVGTVVGGFVGAAAAGIAANTVLGEPVRQLGENIGGTVEKGWNATVDAGKAALDAASDFGNGVKEGAKNLLSGGAKALGSLFG
ncbi:hypothetical protein UBJ12_21040, partial [Halalkalibacterium halodurans]|nr:hypothetical protein [Halalkalibacterium halodurans]